ncbi:MAG: DNA topoisomerase IB [Pseudomonadota bacterium]
MPCPCPHAELRYVDTDAPGITRRRLKRGWAYRDAGGARITDRDEIERLNAIGLPPAYTDAWFCPDSRGHIQAIGVDARGRRQYRYHSAFRAMQEAAKYSRCADFARALPALRRQVTADLARRHLVKERAVAAVVRLLDLGRLRVGNESYAITNKSFGATTLRKRHARVTGATLRLQFRAKSGRMRVMAVTDATLGRFVKRCQQLPGQHLFAWLDADGCAHPVTSTCVNYYLRAVMGTDFTARDFRTWGTSVLAFEALSNAPAPISLAAMLDPVTAALGNTPAVARRSYVHPDLVALARDKAAQAAFRAELRLPRRTRYLSRYERGLIAFLDAPVSATVRAAA